MPRDVMKNASCTCTADISPDQVDAGAEIAVKVRAEASRGHSLRGASISIRNQKEAELTRAVLERSDDGAWEANDIVLAAPRVAGAHRYRAVVVAADKSGVLHEQASTEVVFEVKPHAAQLNVWDVPSAIVAGERFKVSVGVRCSAGCNLGDRALGIFDHEGSRVGTVTLGHDVWPGTDALYFAGIEAAAPLEAGSYEWEIRIPDWDSELPHASGALPLCICVVSAPDCEVTVSAFDREQQTPIRGARVVMHPYRAVTDESGIARIRVSRGQYDLLVSGSKYLPVCTSIDVTGDVLSSVALDADLPEEPPE